MTYSTMKTITLFLLLISSFSPAFLHSYLFIIIYLLFLSILFIHLVTAALANTVAANTALPEPNTFRIDSTRPSE